MTEYQIKKLSGYQLMKIIGEGKDNADMMRDMIIAATDMKKEEVEGMPLQDFTALVQKISTESGLNAEDLKKNLLMPIS